MRNDYPHPVPTVYPLCTHHGIYRVSQSQAMSMSKSKSRCKHQSWCTTLLERVSFLER